MLEKVDITRFSPNNECLTGEIWGDKPVYTKLIDIGVLPNATTKNVNTGLAGIDYCWIDAANSMCFNAGASYPFPYVDPSGIANSITGRLSANFATLTVSTKTNWSTYSCIVALKYTKA